MAAPYAQLRAILFILSCANICRAHVVELDDRFLEARKEGKWLVEFYAPWCGYCQKIQPIWSDVGEQMAKNHPEIRVSRLDGTRYGSIMDLYDVKGFPTIIFVEGDRTYTHRGGRTSVDIINFALRAQGPAVRKLEDQMQFRQAQRENDVSFILVAEDDTSDLQKYFSSAAEDKILDSNFYYAAADVIPEKSRPTNLPALLVFKDGTSYKFEDEVTEENVSSWVLQELITAFPMLTSDNIFNIFKGGKAVVIILTFPSVSNAKKHPHYLMKEVLKEAALHHRDKYHKRYQFVHMEDKAFMQELVLTSLEIPSILVFDPTTYLYYLMDQPEKVTQESLEEFLNSVSEGLHQAHGGNSFLRRLYRVFYEIVTSVGDKFEEKHLKVRLHSGYLSSELRYTGDDGNLDSLNFAFISINNGSWKVWNAAGNALNTICFTLHEQFILHMYGSIGLLFDVRQCTLCIGPHLAQVTTTVSVIMLSVMAMWTAQPLLTSFLLGLPSLLMIFVCYSLCTAEPTEEGEMDSEDEGEEGLEDHQKDLYDVGGSDESEQHIKTE